MKLVTLAQAVAAREAARSQGRYLLGAKEAAAGGLLIVGVNTDASVRASKGPGRPIVPEAERAELVAALGCVDLVVLFDEPDASAFLTALRPDLHVKGTDYTAGSVPERELVARLGGRTVIVGDPKDHSTSDLIARIREHS